MDIPDALGIEFLDLSDVDEYERNRVLASLQPTQPNTEFPWFIGDGKSTFISKSDDHTALYNDHISGPKPRINDLHFHNHNATSTQPRQVNHQLFTTIPDPPRRAIPIIDPKNGLPIPVSNPVNNTVNPILNNQQQYFNHIPQFFPPPVVTSISVPIAQNYVNYSVSHTNHEIPVNTTFFAPNFPVKSSVFYGVPPVQPIFMSHQSTNLNTGNYYESQNVAPEYMQNASGQSTVVVESGVGSQNLAVQEKVWESTEFSVQSPDLEISEAIQNEIVETVEIQSTVVDTIVAPEEMTEFVPENIPDPQEMVSLEQEPLHNDTAPIPSVWGGAKSWASLFSSKEGSLGNLEVNGMKPAFTKVLNTESNNNKVLCPFKNPKSSKFIDPDCYRMAEFLTNFALDGRAVSLQPRGLINQSNYCYINSILQALIACPPMYNLLSGLSQNISSNEKRKPTPVIDGMCRFVKEFNFLPANMRVSNRRSDGGKNQQKKDQGILINTDIPFEPSWIYKMLNGIGTGLIEGRQEDAEEFLGCLLNNLNDEMLELIKLIKNEESNGEVSSELGNRVTGDEEDKEWQVMGPKNKGSVSRKTLFDKTPITDIFGGSLKSRIHRTGDHITENTQPFLTLQLNIEKVKTVREALEALTSKYQLEGLTSSKTNEEVEAWQQVMLDELPVVLVLHLKCFDYKLDGCTKIVKALEFPIDLKIDTKLLSSKTSTTAKEKQYKLFAVVYHDGKEATKGHYITDAFHVGYSSWLRYDDASVKQVQEENVLKPQGTRVPYLLFYRRSDTIRSR